MTQAALGPLAGLRTRVEALEEGQGAVARELSGLATDLRVVRGQCAILVEHYLSEHPSKVGEVAASLRAPAPRSAWGEVKPAALIGVIVVLSQVVLELAKRLLAIH